MRSLIYAYDQAWVDLDYKANMASGKLMLPPPKQFRRVYQFLSTDHAIANIALRRIKVSRAEHMNHPYELLPYHNQGGMGAAMKLVRDSIDANARFLCFSADWGSPVMWAHYADRHRGICLGFNMLRVLKKRVRYTKDRLAQQVPLISSESPTWPNFVDDLITTKCDHWAYEKEIRYVVPLRKTASEGSLRFFRFDETLQLAEVILGVECNASVEEIRALVNEKHPDALVFGARYADKWFRIVPDEETAPWLPPG